MRQWISLEHSSFSLSQLTYLIYKKPDDAEVEKGVYATRIVLVSEGFKYKGSD